MSQKKEKTSASKFKSPFGDEMYRFTVFLTFLSLYYILVTDDGDVLVTTPLKCLPICGLMLYNYLKGFKLTTEFRYSQMIMIGLMCSMAGDLLLNIDLFPAGMGAFALAQISYISAFKMSPLKPLIGLPLFALAGGMTWYIYDSLDAVLQIALPIYATLLCTMCWRSIVRAVELGGSLASLCALGSVLFVISDSLICVQMFLMSYPNSRFWIMTTYYVAQFLITLSTLVDTLKDSPKKSKRQKRRRLQD